MTSLWLQRMLVVFAAMGLPQLARAGIVFDFEVTAPGGAIDENVGLTNAFPLMLGPLADSIASLELEIKGLTHADPMELNVALLDPFGLVVLDIMNNRGGEMAISGVNLLFTDSAVNQLPVNGQIISGFYQPEQALAAFNGFDGGTNAWILLITDDTVNGITGSFTEFTLRGNIVPEPATLSLLAFGALAVLRRKKK